MWPFLVTLLTMFKFFLCSSISCSQSFARSLSPSTSLLVSRNLHTTIIWRDCSFTNFLADDNPPPAQASSLSDNGILLADGLLIPAACIFLEGKIFMGYTRTQNQYVHNLRTMVYMDRRTFSDFWCGDSKTWWAPSPACSTIFFCVHKFGCLIGILLLGTGRKLIQPPPFIQAYLGTLGIQLDVMDMVCISLSCPLQIFITTYIFSK